jgi:hypothetical protein
MVITGEIGERIRTLCYIGAFAPADGQSLLDICGVDMALAFLDQASRSGGMIPPIPAALFNVNEEDAARVDKMSVAQPLATFGKGCGPVWNRTPLLTAHTSSRPRTGATSLYRLTNDLRSIRCGRCTALRVGTKSCSTALRS